MSGERTEKATPRRREKSRKEGQVVRSRDAAGAVGLMCGVAGLLLTGVWWKQEMYALLADALNPDNGLLGLRHSAVRSFSVLALPPMLAALSGAGFTMLAQNARFSVHPENLFKISRLSTIGNIKKLFSASALMRVFKSMLPAAALLYIAHREMTASLSTTLRWLGSDLNVAAAAICALVWGVLWRGAGVLLLWGVADYLVEWRHHERSLKMSKEELRQEAKESDGNPQTKAKIRRLQRQVRRRRMLQDVKRSTVVVTNPTHFAIALEFDPKRMPAPVVLAKGVDRLALQIKSLARLHNVMVIENRPLAHALYRTAQVGEMVPPKLYVAVAEVLAFIYRTEAELQARQRMAKGTKQ